VRKVVNKEFVEAENCEPNDAQIFYHNGNKQQPRQLPIKRFTSDKKWL